MFSITEKYKNLVSQLYPDDVVTYYNPLHGVALVCGECFIGLYVSHDKEWAFVMEYSKSEIKQAFDAARNIESHRLPAFYLNSQSETPSNAAEIFGLDVWDGQPLPF